MIICKATYETRYLAQLSVIIIAKDSGLQDALFKHNGMIDLAKEVDNSIKKIQVNSHLQGIIEFKEVCAKSRSTVSLKLNCDLHTYRKVSKIRQPRF